MAFATLSRRHVVCKRRSQIAQKVSSPLRKCVRSDSLRSTWLTNDSMDEKDEEMDELQTFAPLPHSLSDWVYWQRDAVALPDCWTRVFAVFCGNLLWLYRYEDASAKSLLVRMRVTALNIGPDLRKLHFRDANAANVLLYMPDASAFDRWHTHVAMAMEEFLVVEEEGAKEEVVVALVLQKKSFWKAFAKDVAQTLGLRKRPQMLQL